MIYKEKKIDNRRNNLEMTRILLLLKKKEKKKESHVAEQMKRKRGWTMVALNA